MLPCLKVLFLCTGNSCRSQMAEAWTRKLHPERVEAQSAGTNPSRLDPRAVQVMTEAGVDMSTHRSKHIEEMAGIAFDCVITVCDSAKEHCPVFPGQTRHLHKSFDDPPRLAAGATSEETALTHYRRVRDEIRDYVLKLPEMVACRGPGDRMP